MKLLLDTHLLIWAASDDTALSGEARAAIEDTENTLFFSVASIWEIVIKTSLGRDDFRVDARVLRRSLIDAGYEELAIQAPHVLEIERLPMHHKDPFDRLLLGQAIAEGILLLTHDEAVRQYALAPVRYV